MGIGRAFRIAFIGLLVCTLAASGSLVRGANAGSSASAASAAPAGTMSKAVGTASTRMVINRFRAVGRKVVGVGTVIASYTSTSGVRTVKRRHFSLTIRTWHQAQVQQQATVCSILFLQLGTLDLTLAGLHATLHAVDPTQPVRLRLSADDTGGILGRLFCQLSQGSGVLSTNAQAKTAARQLTRHLRARSILRVQATIYAPNQASGGVGGMNVYSPQGRSQVDECQVLHLILGPLHLELLGLVVDLNQVVLDLTAVPGTLLGNIFCQLVTPPPPPPAPAQAPRA
jgi:hypothetical protein